MKRTIGFAAALAFLGVSTGFAQDPAALIEKLKSSDADEADNAREDLLKLGAAAIEPVREAAAKSPDAAFKKTATAIVERRESFLQQMALMVREPNEATVARLTAAQRQFPGTEIRAVACPSGA